MAWPDYQEMAVIEPRSANEDLPAEEDGIFDGDEYLIMLSAPPALVIHLQARVIQSRPVRHDLALSDGEWCDLAADTDA